MSKLSALCLTFLFVASVLLVFPGQSGASQNKDQMMYQKASARLQRLTKDRRKRRLRDQWVRSISEFDKIISAYPKSPYAEKAMYKKAEASYGMYKVSRTQPDLEAAVEAYQQFMMKYPKAADLQSARAKLKSLTGVDPAKEASRRTPPAVTTKKAEAAPAVEKGVKASPAADMKPAAKATTRTTEPVTPAPTGSAGIKSDSPAPAADAAEVPKQDAAPAKTTDAGGHGGLVRIREIRHWSNKGYTRVVIDLDGDVAYKARRIKKPDRLFFDIRGARIVNPLKSGVIDVNDGILKTIRPSQYNRDTVRVVLDLASLASYAALVLPNPPRLVVDVTGKDAPTEAAHARRLGHGRFITLRSIDSKARAQVLAPSPAQQEASVQAAQQPSTAAQPQPPAVQAPPEQATEQPKPAPGQSSTEQTATQPSSQQAAAPAPREAVKPLSLAQQMGLCVGTIVIDPGHGGKDTGAIGKNGLLEKDVVLDIGLRLRDILREELGCKVVMTRDRDVFIDLDARPGIAVQNDADLFISIHANASRSRQARGIETYHLNTTKDRNIMEVAARENMTTMKKMSDMYAILKDMLLETKREDSMRLAHTIQDYMVRDLYKINGAVNNKGVKQGPFLVLYGASMPSILTEIGFISNPEEEKLLASPGYRQEIAQAIYDGIREYISTTKVALNPAP